MRHTGKMRNLICAALFCFTVTSGNAYELADNPALCFGLVLAQSGDGTGLWRQREPHIRALFARAGPKDSTDGRGFDEWQDIGRNIATERDVKNLNALLENCRRLLETAVK